MLGVRFKKAISLFLSTFFIFFTFLQGTVSTCNASDSFDYASYIRGLIGTAAKEWGAAGESTQCVELVKYYVEQLCNVRTYEKALGNGNNIYKRVAQEYPQYFTSIDYYDGMVLMPGDIVSYNSSGWAIDYGHTAIVYEVLGGNYKIAEQWQYSGTVRSNSKTVIRGQYGVPYSIIGIARPNQNIEPSAPGKPDPKVDLPAFEIGDMVNITWDNVENVNSFWLHIYRNGEDYVNKDIGRSLSYSEEFPVGNYTAYIVPYNSFGETLSYVDFVVYDSMPQYAKVALPLNAYEVGDDVTFYLSSDAGNNYTVGIDDANGNRIDTFNTEIGENSYTRTFDTPGQYSCYISTYNNLGQADSERIYFSIYDTKPGYAKVELKFNAYEVGDDVTFYLSSDTGNNYTVGIDDADGNRIDTFNTEIGESTYTRKFDTPGQYSCYISTYNNLGQADSERIYFLIYDTKPGYAKVQLKQSTYEIGDDVTFYLSSDTGNNYTVGIDDADGNRFDTYNTDFLENTYTRKFDVPGQYSCYITTYNNIGHANSERIYFTIYKKGDVNNDNEVSIADVVMLQKWLLTVPNAHLANWKAADLCEDGVLDVFDLCLMKRKLIYG